jgi:hypothetical protein
MSDIAYTIIGVLILIWIAIFGGFALISYTLMFADAALYQKTLDEKTKKDDSKEDR